MFFLNLCMGLRHGAFCALVIPRMGCSKGWMFLQSPYCPPASVLSIVPTMFSVPIVLPVPTVSSAPTVEPASTVCTLHISHPLCPLHLLCPLNLLWVSHLLSTSQQQNSSKNPRCPTSGWPVEKGVLVFRKLSLRTTEDISILLCFYVALCPLNQRCLWVPLSLGGGAHSSNWAQT